MNEKILDKKAVNAAKHNSLVTTYNAQTVVGKIVQCLLSL